MKTRIETLHHSELTPELYKSIVQVNYAAYAKYRATNINMRGLSMTWEQLAESLRRNDETVFLLYEGDSLAAYARGVVEPDAAGTLFLRAEGLAALPECEKKGYAPFLARKREKWAKKQGAQYARLDTCNRASETKQYHHASGYRDWYYRYLGGRNYISIYMRKDYGAPYPAYRRLLRLWATYLLVRSLHTEYGSLTLFGRFVGKLNRGFRLLKSKLGKH